MNYRKLSVLILAVVLIIGSCTAFALDSYITEDRSQTYVKIGLFYGSSAKDIVTLESGSGFYIADADDSGWTEAIDLTAYKKLKVTNNNNTVCILNENGEYICTLGENQAVMSVGRSLDEMYITINDVMYRDGAAFRCESSGKLTVMSYVSVEHYLWGVVSSEMSYKKALEALKTQAVCARSFVYAGSGKHRSYGFDLCNTACCQVYKPVNLEYESIIRACNETKNMVITYNGKVVIGYYFSHSSGHTLNTEDVWTGVVPYARGVEDEYSSRYDWTFVYTFGDIEKLLADRGINLGKIQKVSISQTGEFGAVTAMLVEGTEGSKEFSKSTMKSVFKLKSQTFTISGDGFENPEEEPVAATNQENELVTEKNGTVSTESFICILGADGNVIKKNPSELVVSNGKDTVSGSALTWDGFIQTEEVQSPDSAPLQAEAQKGYSTSGYVYFTGTGYGHGVGLSQTGAQNMANKGMNYIDILNYYFTDVEIKEYERK